ncbi:MAG TPA: alpha/beta hydrolase family protein [Terriglobales bacterium]|jgi:putative tributyrin esterase|nr:alpha/beta hydrolase family protein [Terriglobales bacterium]
MICHARHRLHGLFLSLLFAAACIPASAADLPTVLPRNVKIVQFSSASLGDERTLLVILPLDYDTSTSRYPTLYLLHGYDADITDWARGTNLTAYAAEHHLIIVTPDASRGWYVNSVSDPKARFDDFIVKDVVSYVDAHFRTIPERFARAIAGVSMGGYGATFLGLEHSDTFAAVGSFSGALGIVHMEPPKPSTDEPEGLRKFRQEMESRFGTYGSKEQKDRDPFELAAKISVEQAPMLFIVCGGEDGLAEINHQFISQLAKRRIAYEYRELSPREHDWNIWNEEIPIFLDKLDHLEGFGSALPEDHGAGKRSSQEREDRSR